MNGAAQAGCFMEFFAGGGMARLAIGAKLRCTFANDFDDRKATKLPREFRCW